MAVHPDPGATLEPVFPVRRRPLGALVLAVVVLGGTACVPQQRGGSAEVREGTAAAPTAPPRFPASGPVSAELLAQGLLYDFTSVPNDLNLWVPPARQARCAADKTVATLGAARLSELGYRPATSGASLNDIGLTTGERDSVALLFQSCVDLAQGVAAMLMGDSLMNSREALCVSKGLASKNLLAPFVEAWAFGRAVDPFAPDTGLADALLNYSSVCLPDNAFTWYDANLPGEDNLQGTGLSGASSTTTTSRAGSSAGTSSPARGDTTAPP